MKKTVCMLLALLLAVVVPASALAEASGGTQSDEAVISGAIDALKEYWKQISGYGASDGTQSDEAVISGAIDALKEYWKQMYQSGKHGDGYLEIRSTRVFTSPIRFCRRTTRRHTSFLTTWFASWSLYCCRTTVIPRPIT